MSLITERVMERVESEPAQILGPLDNPLPAPTVGEILADREDFLSREADPVYLHSVPYHDGLSEEANQLYSHGLSETLTATTEADALFDLNHKLMTVAGVIRTLDDSGDYERWAQLADKLRTELAFIGRKEFDTATEAIAAHWLNVLDQSPTGELPIVVEIDGSGVYVYGAVRKALGRLNPDAAARLRPVRTGQLKHLSVEGAELVRAAGLRLVNDWSISGEQMEAEIGRVIHGLSGINRNQLEIDLVCARDIQLQYGLAGVKCNSYYKYNYQDDQRIGRVSLTGAHCNTDYGFSQSIEVCYNNMKYLAELARQDSTVRDGYERLPLPLLHHIARYYALERMTSSCVRQESPETLAHFDRVAAESTDLIASLKGRAPAWDQQDH